jgi:hypothetical protein
MTTTTTTIKQQLESVNHIDLNLFYSVTTRIDSIQLQGHLSGELKNYCESLGFEFEITKNNWIQSKKENIIVVLTF